MDRITALRAFVRLVEVGSFTAVANELRVKQSTVSKWLVALEADYDSRLIDRTTRAQRVTEAGVSLYEHARVVVAAYDESLSSMRSATRETRGKIRISLPVVFGRLFVVPLIASFLRRHPRVEADIVFADRYVSLVEEGFDVAIRVGIPVDSSLRTHALGDTARRLVASPRYLKSSKAPRKVRDLAEHECLVHAQPGIPATWKFTKKGETQICLVRGRVSANNSEATLALARQGLGICLLASWLVDSDIRSGRLVQLLKKHEPPRAPIAALTPPGRHLPYQVRQLIEHCRGGLAKSLS